MKFGIHKTYPNLSTYIPDTQGRSSEWDETIIYVWGYHSESREGIDIWTTIAQGLWCKLILAMLPWSRIADINIDNKYTLQAFSVRQSALDLLHTMQWCNGEMHLVGTSMRWLVINYMLANCLQSWNHDIIERIGSLQYVIAPLDIRHIRFPFPQVHSTIASLFSLLLKFHPGIRSQAFARELLSYSNPLDSLSWDQTAYESLCYLYRRIFEIKSDITVWYMGWGQDDVIDIASAGDIIKFLQNILWESFISKVFDGEGHSLSGIDKWEKINFHRKVLSI